MGRKLKNINLFVAEDGDNSPENSAGSPRAAVSKVASFKRSKQGVQKRVVSVPMKDVERVTGPPPDSWAWRKYGQKPIKGSPYPRGYYRCSSSKGCPARKQVERNKADPTLVTVTYSCDHNHPLPASRSNRYRTPVARSSVSEDEEEEEEYEEQEVEEEEEDEEMELEKNPNNSITSKSDQNSDEKLADFALIGGEFGWFSEFETSSSCTVLETPIPTEDDRIAADGEMAMVFTMGEEDESLFADLGELPECSAVFRQEATSEPQRRSLATTGW